jgi:ABC-type phosphate transport system substrate-binding protein
MKATRVSPLPAGLKLRIAAAASILLTSVCAHAGGFKVIANNSVAVSAVSAADLKNIFLEDSDSLGGTHVLPVLQKDGATHEAFAKQYLNRTPPALDVFYRALVFTGKASMPKVFATDAEVVAYVAKTKGAIGYVSNATATDGVKTLQVN